MRFRHPARVMFVFAAIGVVAVAACGLDVLATGDGSGAADATADGLVEGGAGDALADAGSQVDLPPLLDPFDGAGVDASPDNCLAGCDGGSCDGGWCVLDCTATSGCTDRVVCPPGIPCEVHCGGVNACAQGVDCTAASACRVGCGGTTSCAQSVTCSGAACGVQCSGPSSCAQGVACDAGACSIGCLGTASCANLTTCNANACAIRCGVSLDNGKTACSQGVECSAAKSCDIGCAAHDTCKSQPVIAYSPGTVDIECAGQGSCNKGSVLSGGDAGILCSGAMACGSKTFCDAGTCSGTCTNDNFAFCCKGGGCTKTQAGCSISAGGCPP